MRLYNSERTPADTKAAAEKLLSTPLSALPFPTAVLALDQRHTILAASNSFYSLLGCINREAFAREYGASLSELVDSEDFERLSACLHTAASGEKTGGTVFSPLSSRTVYLLSPYSTAETIDGLAILCTFSDASQQHRLERLLSYERQRCDEIIKLSSQFIFEYDYETTRIANCSIWMEWLNTGVDRSRFAEGLVRRGILHRDDIVALNSYLDTLSTGKVPEPIEVRFRHDKYEYVSSKVNGTILRSDRDVPLRFIGAICPVHDNTSSLAYLDATELDPLTGLYGRHTTERMIFEFVNDNKHLSGALFLISLDRLKEINQSRGHLFGDTILCEATALLRSCLGADDLLGRYSGAILVAFCPGITDEAGMLERGTALRDQINRKFCDRNSGFSLDCHIGMALCSDGDTSEALYRRADIMLHRSTSKDAGLRIKL